MVKNFRILIGCCVAIIAALVLVVGVVSHGVLRHIVQTSPLWIAIVLSARRSALAKWAALPCFVWWLLLMAAIWLYLLGWAQILFIGGTFSPVEIAMTLVVGLASLVGLVTAMRTRSGVPWLSVTATILLLAVLQVGALRLSFLPSIAHH